VSKQAKRDRQRQNREVRRQYEQTIARRKKTFKTARTFAILVVPVLVLGIVLSISNGSSGSSNGKSAALAAGCRYVAKVPKETKNTKQTVPPLAIDPTKTYTATVDTSCGSFTITLDPKEAPQSVNSFVSLAKQGFYDNLIFHRVVKDFVIQGGDPNNDGTGGPGYNLPDEPPAGGYQKGSVALANAGPGTSGSGFYIVTTTSGAKILNSQKTSDGKFSYSILGQVTGGFDTAVRINKLGSTNTSLSKQQPKAIVLVDKITITEGTSGATTTTTVPSTTTTT
jgi:cyclophilin family peptidyl-prolyl cis-trans isomerase